MTCFWDHILKSLNQEDLKILNIQKNNQSDINENKNMILEIANHLLSNLIFQYLSSFL